LGIGRWGYQVNRKERLSFYRKDGQIQIEYKRWYDRVIFDRNMKNWVARYKHREQNRILGKYSTSIELIN